VRHRRKREIGRSRRIGRISTGLAVDSIEPFRLRIIRFKLFVSDWPSRRDTFFVLQLTKIFSAQPRQCGSVNLGVATDEIVYSRRKRNALVIVPNFLRLITAFSENSRRIPILTFARKKISAFYQEDVESALPERVSQSSASHPCSDDDEIIFRAK
jgi:hypothetical protein